MEGNKWTMELDVQNGPLNKKDPVVIVTLFEKITGEIRQKRYKLQEFYDKLNYHRNRYMQKKGEETPEIVGVLFAGTELQMEADDELEKRH